MTQNEPLLSVREVTISFGGVHAVDRLSFDVPRGGIIALIGPNGAGKTTLLNSVSGFTRARGSILYRGRELLNQPAHRRAAIGIGRTFQSLELYGEMTVLDNVLTGAHALLGGNVMLDLLRFPVIAREESMRRRAREILRLLDLERYANRQADTLPFGIQKLAGVARALAAASDLLLMDEPAAGLNRQEAETLGRIVRSLRHDLGLTILLVEHNMHLVMEISDSVVVLDQGRKLAEGPPLEVRGNPAVIEAYLGSVAQPEVMVEVEHELADRP